MKTSAKIILAVAVLALVGSLSLWIATDRHSYTKFRVKEQVESKVDSDDPLADTGFYDGGVKEEVVTRDEFHLGLLPTPKGLFDKHALSVASISGPPWLLVVLSAFLSRRRTRRNRD